MSGPFSLVLDGSKFRYETIHDLTAAEREEIVEWNRRALGPLTPCCGAGTAKALIWTGERCQVESSANHFHDIEHPPAWLMRYADRIETT